MLRLPRLVARARARRSFSAGLAAAAISPDQSAPWGVPRPVWDAMAPSAQAAAARAGAQRALLARALPLLTELGGATPLPLSAADARRLGATVLLETAGGAASVAVAPLPRLDHAVQSPPRSACARRRQPHAT
jgi:hypothetical protein